MSISAAVRARVRKAANNHCGYCNISAEYIYSIMEIDHIIPQAAGGPDDESNLWLACPRCNTYKSDQTHYPDPQTNEKIALFNPRTQRWNEHFMWHPTDPARIDGITPVGRATVEALKLNIDTALQFRRLLVQAGWHPPA